jgi:hypothetical protein
MSWFQSRGPSGNVALIEHRNKEVCPRPILEIHHGRHTVRSALDAQSSSLHVHGCATAWAGHLRHMRALLQTSCRRATGSLSRSLVKRCASCAPRETATYAMRLLSRSFAPSHWERLLFELRISRRREHCNSRNTYVQTSEQSWQRDSQSHR